MSISSRYLTFAQARVYANSSINTSIFSYINSEYVKHLLKKYASANEVEAKLFELGESVGPKAFELACVSIGPPSSAPFKRELKAENLLQWLAGPFFKWLFGSPADSLDKVSGKSNEYYIRNNTPITMKNIDTYSCSVALPEYQAGILQSVIAGAGMKSRVEVKSYEAVAGEQASYIFVVTLL